MEKRREQKSVATGATSYSSADRSAASKYLFCMFSSKLRPNLVANVQPRLNDQAFSLSITFLKQNFRLLGFTVWQSRKAILNGHISQHSWANNVGSCCVRVSSVVQMDATTPSNVGTCGASKEGYNPKTRKM